MKVEKQQLDAEVFSLLGEWCDALIRLQLDMPKQPEFDGGILCPACKMIHGRCGDAIYPMMYMADRTGDKKYLASAIKLFNWAGNLLCDDGSLYNDAQSTWNGITAFNAISLHDALARHGKILDEKTKAAWEKRLLAMGEWLHGHLVTDIPTNINYFAANACAMALLGEYFDRADFRALAHELSDYCLSHISQNGLLFGEGRPSVPFTAKGCRAIDAGGYNVEESLPSLIRYAIVSGDKRALEIYKESFGAHLKWMLPDGAWDNSVGTRNFKWTYWGGRTSDGCQEALTVLGRDDAVFAEAALRNLRLYEKCTHDGLLFGGPDYMAHGEKACVHHTFCHAKVLAGMLDSGLYAFERQCLPSDNDDGISYYPELDTYRLARGDWKSDITAYDFEYMRGGHASGGALSLLWHKKCGPVVAVGTVDYSLREAHNQQLSLLKAEHKSTCPRIEAVVDGRRLGQHYDFEAGLTAMDEQGTITVHADCCLSDEGYRRIGQEGKCTLEYALTSDSMRIKGTVTEEMAGTAEYILPVVADAAEITLVKGTYSREAQRIFNLNPGFICREFRIRPNDKGVFELVISINQGTPE